MSWANLRAAGRRAAGAGLAAGLLFGLTACDSKKTNMGPGEGRYGATSSAPPADQAYRGDGRAAGDPRLESAPKDAAPLPKWATDRPAGMPPPPPVVPAAPVPESTREEYNRVVDNAFQLVSREPLSTFSADVDTAGYSNVRRFLTNGSLPPKDAVRIEELVNYFEYEYPAPQGPHPVEFANEMSVCPWNARHLLLRVGVQARKLDPRKLPPRNLVFLVDTSGSMAPENRLPLVKRALHLLVGQLTAQDRVSVVTYAGESSLRLQPTPGSEQERIRAVIDGLHAGGSTNGAGGLRMAYEQARMGFVDGGANRVILATDGDFNVGISDKSELIRYVESQRQGGIYLTVLGFGMGNLKDGRLEAIAQHGDGHYAYIDSIDEARKVFVEQGGALVTVAKDVKLQLEFNPRKVAAYRLIGYENRVLAAEDFKDDKKDAGDMGSGHTVTALYELVPAGEKVDIPGVDPLKYSEPLKPSKGADSEEWLTVKMRYKEPEGGKSKEVPAAVTGGPAQATSADFRFAAAVAEFGLVLRDSPYKGTGKLTAARERAEKALGSDPGGHRAEFVKLVQKAEALMAPAPPKPE